MIVEDERDIYQNNIDYDSVGNNTSTFEVSLGAHSNIRSTYLQRRVNVHDRKALPTSSKFG